MCPQAYSEKFTSFRNNTVFMDMVSQLQRLHSFEVVILARYYSINNRELKCVGLCRRCSLYKIYGTKCCGLFGFPGVYLIGEIK